MYWLIPLAATALSFGWALQSKYLDGGGGMFPMPACSFTAPVAAIASLVAWLVYFIIF